MGNTIEIYVGCDPNDCDLEQMMLLEYSLRARASLPLNIHWMRLSRDPASPWYCDPDRRQGWRTETWSTPFSGFRWAVPACHGYRGRAIYMDADMLALCDIAEVWRTPMPAGTILAGRPDGDSWLSCVLVWDCERARAHLPALEALRSNPHAHRDMKRHFDRHLELIAPLDARYNSIDGDGRPVQEIGILHYSDMRTQFSHRYSVPRLQREGRVHWFDGTVLAHPRKDLAALFDASYAEALAAGYTLDAYRAEVLFGPLVKESQKHYTGTRGKARRSLLDRLKRGFSTSATS